MSELVINRINNDEVLPDDKVYVFNDTESKAIEIQKLMTSSGANCKYAECETALDVPDKIVTCNEWRGALGESILIYFKHTGKTSDSFRIVINGTSYSCKCKKNLLFNIDNYILFTLVNKDNPFLLAHVDFWKEDAIGYYHCGKPYVHYKWYKLRENYSPNSNYEYEQWVNIPFKIFNNTQNYGNLEIKGTFFVKYESNRDIVPFNFIIKPDNDSYGSSNEIKFTVSIPGYYYGKQYIIRKIKFLPTSAYGDFALVFETPEVWDHSPESVGNFMMLRSLYIRHIDISSNQ